MFPTCFAKMLPVDRGSALLRLKVVKLVHDEDVDSLSVAEWVKAMPMCIILYLCIIMYLEHSQP